MKALKKIILCVLTLMMLVSFCVTAYADDSVKHANEEYYIEKYDVNINVLENNTLEITENISAFFNQHKHGIFREIPIKSHVTREDGSTGTVRAKIKDVEVSEAFDTYTEDNYYVIQIGDEDKTVYGSHDYTISYSYVMGKDICDGFDELYFNIIGTGWATYIDNVTFTINMPKDFDTDKIGFSTGNYGSVGTDDIVFDVNSNVISGRVTKELGYYEAVTARIELPEGYFTFNVIAYYSMLSLMVIIPLIAFVIVLVLWNKYGKDKKVVDVVEFYPPENMSSLDVAFWKKGVVTSNDVIPLLIELANEGYLSIEEYQKDSLLKKKKDFVINYIKAYNGNDECKREFFNGLFRKGRRQVYKKDLTNKFYKTINTILEIVNDSDNIKKVYDSKSMNLVVVGLAVSVISAVGTIFISNSIIGGKEKIIACAIGILIAIISFIISFFIRRRTEEGYLTLQKIEGFKKFLETAEKERLEMLVDENPEYFYNILPYAYVLGVSDKWTKKFESIAIEPPRWYYGYDMFDMIIFHSFMNETYRSVQNAMISSPQSSSGGSSIGGGGGFSGGGVGGGGGGSW